MCHPFFKKKLWNRNSVEFKKPDFFLPKRKGAHKRERKVWEGFVGIGCGLLLLCEKKEGEGKREKRKRDGYRGDFKWGTEWGFHPLVRAKSKNGWGQY